MTDELDLLTRYMADAPDPGPNALEASRRILEFAIEEEHASSAQSGAVIYRSRTIRRCVLAGALVAVAAAAVLVAALVVPTSSPSHAPVSEGAGAPSSWRLVDSTTSPFRSLPPGGQTSLQCVTDTVCYSPGATTSQLFRTTDGGESWQATAPVPVAQNGLQSSFACADVETCVVLGPPGTSSPHALATFARTTDGGRSWSTSSISTPAGIPGAYIGRFSCGDALHCVVSVGGNTAPGASGQAATGTPIGTFLSTADGGKTWTQATTAPSAAAASVWTMTCTSDGSCLAVSAMGRNPDSWIVGLSSRDWGLTWVAGPPAVYNDAPILYASCGDATHCMLVPLAGPSGAPYEIATTSDAGQTWQVQARPAGWENIATGVDCANATDCWIATSLYDGNSPAGAYSEPTIESTHNGGSTWSTVALPAAKPPIADVLTLSCPPSGDGCMGIGNLQDHFLLPKVRPPKPQALSGPLVISNLPPADPS